MIEVGKQAPDFELAIPGVEGFKEEFKAADTQVMGVSIDIRENPEYETELIALCGAKTVPVLVVDGKPLKGSEEISQYLVGRLM